jgi:hypothetical protein
MRERKECLNEKRMFLEKEERKKLIEKQKKKRNGGKTSTLNWREEKAIEDDGQK